MFVQIGDKLYRSDEQPIKVVFSKEEIHLIRNMNPQNNTFCAYPDTEEWTADNCAKIKAWMGADTVGERVDSAVPAEEESDGE